MGGGNHICIRILTLTSGLSPRGRGKQIESWDTDERERSIPAWAGETYRCEYRSLSQRVYPRVGGGNIKTALGASAIEGLSPRGRGKPGRATATICRCRSIPAWAGETETLGYLLYPIRVYPRVGGGNVIIAPIAVGIAGLSPRGRGKPAAAPHLYVKEGSIPAWAGETVASKSTASAFAVYPRVGGGNLCTAAIRCASAGLSPRGRGKLGRTRR